MEDKSFMTIDRSGSDCDHNSVTFDHTGSIVQLRIMGKEVFFPHVEIVPEPNESYRVYITFRTDEYGCRKVIISAVEEFTPTIRLFLIASLGAGFSEQQIQVDKILLDGYKTVLNKSELEEFDKLINTKIL